MRNFFGLSSEHQVQILREQYFVSKNIQGISFHDTLTMPTYIRRMYIFFLNDDNKKIQEYIDNQKNQQSSSGGKGRRTSTVSGKSVNSFGAG